MGKIFGKEDTADNIIVINEDNEKNIKICRQRVKYTTEEILSIIFYFLELNLLVGMQLQFVFCKTRKMLRNGKLFSF